MLTGLFRRRQPSVPVPAVPDGTRVYAIGDIHGRADLLGRMHSLILRDAVDFGGTRQVVVYLGDYVDRGLQSRETIDLILDQPLAGFENVYLMGNHEKALLDFLVDSRVATDWLNYGGDATMYSYGVGLEGPRTSPETLASLQQRFRTALPARHLDFFRGLRFTHVEGGYLFAHAGVRPGVALDAQDEWDLIWIRDEFLDSDTDLGKTVVHGHTITREPEIRANRIGIDTGAFDTGRLTCLVLEGEERRFMQT